ncbi:tRNA pseudouridine(38-40) synthase TruA [Halobacteriales archaeon QS_4_62_28]|nr:MAG: tRNA pseudouridine(38-40) synthase TruA [Halobacteriales archaeon QS_4_62_28]
MRAYRIAYDGQPYYGFQRQPDVATVEGELVGALDRLGVTDGEVPAGYAGAGRTDAGVSALAQTVAFEAPDWLSPAAFNSELPAEIRAWASTDVPSDFHATHDAHQRTYCYHLYAPAADDDLAREAARALSGDHDFHNLTPDERGTVRDLSVEVCRDDAFLVCVLRADGFCRQLVRRVVGLVGEIAGGDRPLAKIDRVFDDAPLDGPEGVAPAPPAPLVLTAVDYDVSFTIDADARASARAVFAKRYAKRLASARVARTVRDGFEQ